MYMKRKSVTFLMTSVERKSTFVECVCILLNSTNYFSFWRRDCHFTRSSEPPTHYLCFYSYIMTLSFSPA